MKSFNWNWIFIPGALFGLAAGLFFVFSGNVAACVFACLVFAVVLVLLGKEEESDERVYSKKIEDIAQKAIDIGNELQKDNLGLVEDLEELNKVVEVMSSYITSSVHETINEKIYWTGYEFMYDEDERKYKLFTNRARRKNAKTARELEEWLGTSYKSSKE